MGLTDIDSLLYCSWVIKYLDEELWFGRHGSFAGCNECIPEKGSLHTLLVEISELARWGNH